MIIIANRMRKMKLVQSIIIDFKKKKCSLHINMYINGLRSYRVVFLVVFA